MLKYICVAFILATPAVHAERDQGNCTEIMKKLGWKGYPANGFGQSSVSQIDDKIIISGRIDEDTLAQWKNLNLKGIRTVVLQSAGGKGNVGRQIAKQIRAMNLTTEIPEGSICASACTLMFQAGAKRKMHTRALLGYHGGRVDFSRLPELKTAADSFSYLTGVNVVGRYEDNITSQFNSELERYGISKQLTNISQSVSGNSLHCVDALSAKNYRAATEVQGKPVPMANQATGSILDGVPETDRPFVPSKGGKGMLDDVSDEEGVVEIIAPAGR